MTSRIAVGSACQHSIALASVNEIVISVRTPVGLHALWGVTSEEVQMLKGCSSRWTGNRLERP